MGLINPDVHTTSSGVTKTDTYISFNTETLYLRQNGVDESGNNLYMVNANYRIFWDHDSKINGKAFLDLQSVSAVITEAELSSNIYTVLYDKLKLQYPNATDA